MNFFLDNSFNQSFTSNACSSTQCSSTQCSWSSNSRENIKTIGSGVTHIIIQLLIRNRNILFFSFDQSLYDPCRCLIFVFILFFNLFNGALSEYGINQYLLMRSIDHFLLLLLLRLSFQILFYTWNVNFAWGFYRICHFRVLYRRFLIRVMDKIINALCTFHIFIV